MATQATDGDQAKTLLELDFDPDALRAKYHEERDKRLRPQKNEQWIEVEGEFSHYTDDPYINQPLVRDALREETEVVIVGGGFGGLIAAADLRMAGVADIRIIEKAGDFGGTWYWNRYPGAQCDVESYIYLPLLEETGYIPTEKYAYAPEILEHARRIGRHFDLYRAALFETQIKDMRWRQDCKRWLVKTDRGDEILARFVISASGPLNRPKLPGIAGIQTFKGHMFHTSRWDYAYTGGDNRGGMTKLTDKRVAVIGTGATGIQCIPYIARDAAHLYVLQRTPSNVDVRGNRPTDSDWANSLKAGWQAHRMANFNIIVAGGRVEEDLVKDGWTDMYNDMVISLLPRDGVSIDPEELARLSELADFRKGNQVRARVDEMVKDPATAEKLKAWYPMFCKRPTYNDDYLPVFNSPNVSLIDTHGAGVEKITEKGLVVDGVEYEVDCIIFATGFETGTAYTRRSGFEVYGRDGETLSSHFADGLKTLHGFSSHGFPNFFMLGLSQNALKINIVDMLTEQAGHIAWLIDQARTNSCLTIEPTAEAEAEWRQIIRDKSQRIRAFYGQCTPGYYSGEGNLDQGLFVENFGDGSLEFTKLLTAWREAEDLAGLDLE
jgi:cyclohexanone monooxygenase